MEPRQQRTWARRVRAFFSAPQDPALIEAHRRTVLVRTRAASLIAAVVIPFTILVYAYLFQPEVLRTGLVVSAWAEAGVFAIVWGLHVGIFDRAYHVPFFLLVGVVCTVTEAIVLQLTGGGAQSNFLFPYFLVLFGMATLFPSRFGWSAAAAAMSPLTYVASELWVHGQLLPGRATANLILLLDYAFIAALANRVTTRLFFSEAENRLALEIANRQLRELDRAKSDFFANVSHDLRSPLTVILGPLSALAAEKDELKPRQLQYLKLAQGGAAKLDSMINDLLELARIDAGVGKLRLGRVDLRELVASLIDSSTPYAQSQGLRFVFNAPPDAVIAHLDADKIERVLMNLVSNAIKFSMRGTTIRVELRASDSTVDIAVSDQGQGISPEDLERIFRRFSRGKDETHRRTRGFGLGLAVVKEFVELHGGKVGVESEMGRGATFTVSVPRGELGEGTWHEGPAVVRSRPPAALLLPDAAEAPPVSAGADAPRVLLVEDTDEVRLFLEAELGREFHWVEAADGVQALALMRTQLPDAIILDVMLPEIDGMEVCRQVRALEHGANVPILMYSARGDLQTRLDAFAAGADDFLHKPFEPKELVARLQALLRRSRPANQRGATLPLDAQHGSPH